MRTRGRRYLLHRSGAVRRPLRLLPTVGLLVVVAGLVTAGVLLIRDRTALDQGGVRAGSGELPSSMPDGFPIPSNALIGETTVDPAASTTTVELTTPGTLVSAVSSYTVGLVSAGYVVDRSEQEGAGWVIRFSDLDLRGTLVLEESGGGIRAVLTIVDP